MASVYHIICIKPISLQVESIIRTYLVGRFQSPGTGGVLSFGISLSDMFRTVTFPSWILMAEVAAWLTM